MTRASRRWIVFPSDRPAAERLGRQVGMTPAAAQLLINRGMADPDAARAFLKPDLTQLHDPACLPEFGQAAERIHRAVEAREPIVIYGDYDVDGITATAILLRCLEIAGARPAYYVPDRLEEGYGLNAEAIRSLARQGTKLIVTVDCGVSAAAEVALARKLGVDVIVTDHHEPGDDIPAGGVLINPKLSGCAYPFRNLSGAGLAFKLAWAVARRFSPGDRVTETFKSFLVDAVSLAALGTIADVAPLNGENRVLAHYGLRGIRASRSPGLVALREEAGLAEDEMTAMDVAFRLAPRLNAAGRMGSARSGVELLTTDSQDRAREIAERLGRENARRQRVQEKILAEAEEMIAAEGGLDGRWSIVLAREGWHAGVIGIVAARLTETHWRPTVLLTIEGDEAHGSARAVAPMHLFNALHDCAGRLTAFGGHARAAGLRLKREEFAAFREEFERAAASRLTEEDLRPLVTCDAELRLADITPGLLADLESLAPFGEGNAQPVFAAFGITVPAGVRRMGTGGRHLDFYANQNGVAFRAAAFGLGDRAVEIERARRLDLAFLPRLNRFRGRTSIELDVRDIRAEA